MKGDGHMLMYICKVGNKVVETRPLNGDEEFEHMIVNAPPIEVIPDKVGQYVWSEEKNTVVVEYVPAPKSQEQIIAEIEALKAELSLLQSDTVSLGVDVTDLDIRQLEHKIVYHA